MIIKHTNFQVGIHNFEFVEPCKEIGLEEPFFGDVTVNCRMDKSLYQIVLDLEYTASVKFECDRCNVEFETEIESNNKLVCLYTEGEVKKYVWMNAKVYVQNAEQILTKYNATAVTK